MSEKWSLMQQNGQNCEKSVPWSSDAEKKSYKIDLKEKKYQGGKRIKEQNVCVCVLLYMCVCLCMCVIIYMYATFIHVYVCLKDSLFIPIHVPK